MYVLLVAMQASVELLLVEYADELLYLNKILAQSNIIFGRELVMEVCVNERERGR